MIRNFIMLAYRNLRKRATFSFINVFGLALGMCACLAILKYIDFETSYDNFNEHKTSLYRINRTFTKNGERLTPNTMTTYGLGPALADEIPEVKLFIRTHPGNAVVSAIGASGERRAFHENNLLIVDSTFLDAFTYPVIAGNRRTPLDEPNSIILTTSMARKYFGNEDPIGKDIKLNGGRMNGDYIVTAVVSDVPGNSHLYFDFLLPIHNLFLQGQYKQENGWGTNNFTTYVLLHSATSFEAASERLPAFVKRYLDPNVAHMGGTYDLRLQPLRSIHLEPGINHNAATVRPETLYFFGVIATFILAMAWINYINLSTARSLERAREVGIMKTIGARRSELVLQFLIESVILNTLAVLIAVLLASLLIPRLGLMLGKNFVMDFSDTRLWWVLGAMLIAGTLASGLYPAWIISSYRISAAMKGTRDGFSLRKVLVVFQFACSLLLLGGTWMVYRQLAFMRSQDTGLQMDQMLVVPGPGTISWDESKRRIGILKEQAKSIDGVISVTSSGALPGAGYNWGADIYKSGDEASDFKLGCVVWVDPDFLSTYKIPLIAGRNFDLSRTSDMKAVIVNEASLQAFNLGTAEEALNEQLVMDGDTSSIIGVTKNYNWNSLKSEVTPFLFGADTVIPANLSIHLRADAVRSATEEIGKIYQQLIPGEPFEYYFLDESFNAQYRDDQQFGKIFGLFASLAIGVSCLGLWGLASFTTSKRLKEIGVRKVLGASVSSIVYLLCSQFMRLVVVASLIAVPLGWYGMNSWLSTFAFRIGMSWELFALPMIFFAAIAFLTVGSQVLKGASANPAEVLRSE